MKIFKYINNILNSKYQLSVINTSIEEQLYLWDNWKQILPLLDILINISGNKAYIRSCQSYENSNINLAFGRMVWNISNNEKWTQKYRENQSINKKVMFFNTQIWSPDWNECSKSNITPDIFICLYHHKDTPITKEGLVIAIPITIYNQNIILIESILQKLQKNIPKSVLSQTTRLWKPSNGYPNHIEDINSWEINRMLNF